MTTEQPQDIMADFRQAVIKERQEDENEVIAYIQSRQQRRAQERQSAKELGIQNRFLFLKAQNDRLVKQRLDKIKARQKQEVKSE